MSDDQDLADAILAMVKLSPGEQATVISVVGRMRTAQSEVVVSPVVKPNLPIEPIKPTKAPYKQKHYAEPKTGNVKKCYDKWNKYTEEQKNEMLEHAARWDEYTANERRSVKNALALAFGRNLHAITCQIGKIRNGK